MQKLSIPKKRWRKKYVILYQTEINNFCMICFTSTIVNYSTDLQSRGTNFWDTNMAAVTSCENTLKIVGFTTNDSQPRPQGLLAFQYGGGRREGSALDSTHQNHIDREGLRLTFGHLVTCYTNQRCLRCFDVSTSRGFAFLLLWA